MPLRSRHAALLALLLLLFAEGGLSAKQARQYVFFNRDRERISERSFLETKAFEGAQLKYTWRELEPERDRYAIALIRKDLDLLALHGKKLFLQLQDVSFDSSIINVPPYLLEDTAFHGGTARQYETGRHGRSVPAGYVARRWDPSVQDRWHRLIRALGAAFDGKIEGINLPETSVEFGSDPKLSPPGFTNDAYRDAMIANMRVLRTAFPASVAMLYVNFMPGEWLPYEDHSYLESIFHEAKDLHVALGGPDLLPYRKGQMNNGYEFIRRCRGFMESGIAVQEGNYGAVNPKTRKRVTIAELRQFAETYLGVRYIFWGTQEPFYSRDLVPALRDAK